MPVQFLSPEQRANYGRYVSEPSADELTRYGFRDWIDPVVGFRLSRCLYALCWSGTDQPGVLFERATSWMLAHKVLLPGCTSLERFVARLRNRVENRLWKLLVRDVKLDQKAGLEHLLKVSPQGRSSWLDKLRSGPVRVSGRSLIEAIRRHGRKL